MISGFVLIGLEIKKIKAFETVTEHFNEEESKILHSAENKLVELLNLESSKVASKLETDLENEIWNLYPASNREKRVKLNEKYQVTKLF